MPTNMTADGIDFGPVPDPNGGIVSSLADALSEAAANRQMLRGLASGGVIPASASPGPTVFQKLFGVDTDGTPYIPPQGGILSGGVPQSAVSTASPARAQPAPLSQNATTAMNFFVNKGLSPIAAAGLVGGFANESGSSINPNSVAKGDGRDGSDSVGIANWNGARAQQLRQFAASRGADPSDINTQLEFAWAELNGPEKSSLTALQNAQNPGQATIAALGYERPAGWTQQKPSAAPSFGSRLASTARLAASGASTPQPDGSGPAIAYASPQGSATQAPAQQAISNATSGSAANVPGDIHPFGPEAAGGADSAPVATPVSAPSGPVGLDQIKTMLQDPNTRAAGLQAWKQYVAAQNGGGAPAAPATNAQQPGQSLYSSIATPPSMDQIRAMIVNPATRQLGLQLWQTAISPRPPVKVGAGETVLSPATGQPVFSSPVKLEPGGVLVPGTGGAPISRAPSNLDLKQTGQDDFGRKTFGTFNPQTGQVQPIAAPTGSMGDPATADLHGTDFLSTLSPGVGRMVQAIAEGRQKLPSGTGANSAYVQGLRSAVLQYDPTFDQADVDARYKTRSDFTTGGPNSAASAITAGNTAIAHLGELSDAAEALNNSSYPALNAAGQMFGSAMGGNIAGTQFNNTVGKYVEEATKLYRGTGGTESDIQRDIANLSPSMSPAQLHAAIQQQVQLIQGKISALQERWKQGMGPSAAPFPILSPKSQGVLTKIAQRAGAQPSSEGSVPPAASQGAPAPTPAASTVPPASAPVQVTTPAQAMALPSGTLFRTPDGKVKVRP